MPAADAERRYVTLARLVRTHGIKGELAAELETDDAAVLERFQEVALWDGAARREPARIRHARRHQDRLILQFEGVETMSQAERLAGWMVQIPAEQRPPPPPGRYYLADLLGCRVEEARTGRVLGEVSAFLQHGGTLLLEVKAGGCTISVPFAASICVEIDPEGRRIRVELPEGLEELNPK